MERPWIGHMVWRDLLFAHWPVPARVLRPCVPGTLEIEEFEVTAWIGVVPFLMTGIRPRWLPPAPGWSRMLELNVRTYVRTGGVSGVWFFSLDIESWAAVAGARAVYHLNYFHARMAMERGAGGRIRYESRRAHRGAAGAEFRGEYRPVSDPYVAAAGSLEDWLTARFVLFAADRRGRIFRGDIDHAPWPLQRARAEFEHNTMGGQIGVVLSKAPELLHYSKAVRVRVWGPEQIRQELF